MTRRLQAIEAKSIGQRLRRAREARGMTVQQVGARCEMHYTQVSKVERGLFRMLNERVQKMCKLVKLDLTTVEAVAPDVLHARLDALIKANPAAADALHSLLNALDRLAD
jgi:transcriptional regulator with XRE-family HTH domain